MENPHTRPDTLPPSPKLPVWRRVWHWLTTPPAGLSPANLFRARLLNWLLLILIATMAALFPLIVFIPAFADTPGPPLVFIGMSLVFVVAFALSRTRHLDATAWVTVLDTAAGAWAFAYLQRTDASLLTLNLMFLMFPIFLSGLILSTRATAVLSIANLAGLLLLPSLLSDAEFNLHFPTLVIFVTLSFLIIVAVTAQRQRDQDQILHQSRALTESEERFKLVSYATSDVVWDWDLITDKVWWNENVRRLLGTRTDPPNSTAEWWEAKVHPDDREKFSSSLRAAVQRGDDFWAGEYRLRNHHGDYIHIFDRAFITYNETRQPIRIVGAVMDISERKRNEEALRELSVRDPLTGLFNRRYLEETLNRELWRAARNKRPLGLIMIDLDHFKRFNDTYGHGGGDALLRNVGSFLKAHVRGSDIACRYGGEEFTIVLPDATLEITRQRAEELRQGAQQLALELDGSESNTVTFSLGVAGFPVHGQTGSEVLAAADAALYQAKAAGRDRVVVREGQT